MTKPRVFIGSSTEGLNVAYELQNALDYSCEPTVWTQGVFKLTQSSLTSLMHAVDANEYAVFVMTPDDIVSLRNHEKFSVRDNVVFELGLFIGRYGAKRVFMLQPRDCEQLHIPSDLLGITPATYVSSRADGNLAAALGPACSEIQGRIAECSRPSYPPALTNEFEQLVRQYADILRSTIERITIPKDFPMPESMENLGPERLHLILHLAGGDSINKRVLYRTCSTYDLCRAEAKMCGAPADPLDVLKLQERLKEFRNDLHCWERG